MNQNQRDTLAHVAANKFALFPHELEAVSAAIQEIARLEAELKESRLMTDEAVSVILNILASLEDERAERRRTFVRMVQLTLPIPGVDPKDLS